MPSVLIVDDLTSIHEMLEAVIQPIGFTAAFATDGNKALERYKAEKFDLVLVDVQMKPMDGITLLRELKKHDPQAVVVVMTAYANTTYALDALKLGAFDFLQKPFKVDELISALKRGVEFKKLGVTRAKKTLAPAAGAGPAHADETVAADQLEAFVVGESKKIKKIGPQIKKLTTSKTPVLIIGEPGTGKRVIAELIHAQGNPPGSPLVRFDCSSVTEDEIREGLIGAQSQGGSWIEQAKGGTLFLEEVNALPLPIQKVLVGVLRTAGSSFRLCCSSTEDLEKLIDQGKFHDELFYRIGALPLMLPALRERIEDLPQLLKNFATSVRNPKFDTKQVEFAPDAIAALSAYRWPGNISELSQIVSAVVSEADSKTITAAQLPERFRDLKDLPSLADFLAQEEKTYVERVLRACRGDKAKAAKILGVEVARIG
ncbi:MAG TPA: response regulator [Opitutaceae bacterium]|nr:response regulator [Opitutaceae bacterium]